MHAMRGAAFSLCMLASAVAWSVASLAAPATAPSGSGEFDISFHERSPLSSIDVQRVRYGVERDKANLYDLAAGRFRLHVPEALINDQGGGGGGGGGDGSGGVAPGGWGVVVWCEAGRGARLPRDLVELLAKKKLIAVAAYDAGNDRGVGVRVGLALDAVHNLRLRYPALDTRRTYFGGISGGAKVAEMAAMAFPEIFDGAICCAGANWYKDMPVPGKPNTAWRQSFRKPPPRTFAEARDHVGFILITGPRDGNYTPMRTMFERGFKADGFKHASFYDVPDLGHQTPPAEWFERAIDELDALPKTRVKKLPATRPAPTAR
jgi:hypothetical protein